MVQSLTVADRVQTFVAQTADASTRERLTTLDDELESVNRAARSGNVDAEVRRIRLTLQEIEHGLRPEGKTGRTIMAWQAYRHQAARAVAYAQVPGLSLGERLAALGTALSCLKSAVSLGDGVY